MRSAVAGAASMALRPALAGPRRPARVIAAFPAAVYVELDDPAEPRVVALAAADALRPPNAVALAAPIAARPFAAVPAQAGAWVGGGCVELPGLVVEARRWWDPAIRPGPLDPDRIALLTGGTFGLEGHPAPLRLAERCLAGDQAGAVRATRALVGLGPGLTPSGDDVLTGLLAALWRFRAHELAAAVGAAAIAGQTTALSATLLHCAARGQAGREVAAVLDGLSGHAPLERAVARLLGAGHTSGADLIWGMAAGCRASLSSMRKATA